MDGHFNTFVVLKVVLKVTQNVFSQEITHTVKTTSRIYINLCLFVKVLHKYHKKTK